MLERKIEQKIHAALARGKSVLLIGPRQTGKTTLVLKRLAPDFHYNFASLTTRQRYEQRPELFEQELKPKLVDCESPPLVFIDEVQKVPAIMDSVQLLIDEGLAQFILSGSSARQLKVGRKINLLPGRLVRLVMTPLLVSELPTPLPDLEQLLLFGKLPGIVLEPDVDNKEQDLNSYVTSYLEDEIRSEAVVRQLGSFSRFLQVAASESNNQINFTKLANDVGIADTTIANYYQILEDCLIANRIEPITKSYSKRRLTKSAKVLFFDSGIRRSCAKEGTNLPERHLGHLFEAFVGNELIAISQNQIQTTQVRYWRDSKGAEIDFVLESNGEYTPIEVKWSDSPSQKDARHLVKFLEEYPNAHRAFIVCRTPTDYELTKDIRVISWQTLESIWESL